MEAFNLVKDTLEHLEFVCWIKEEIDDQSALAEGMCHFQDFPALISLSISPDVLLGSDPFLAPRIDEVVPPKLKKLCFTDDLPGNKWDASSITEVLYDFVEGDWGASTPGLEKVYVANDVGWLSETQEAYLRDLCMDNGFGYGV
jgi:hypothetical protein